MSLHFHDVIHEKVLDTFGSFGNAIVSIPAQFQIPCDFIWLFFEKRTNVLGWHPGLFDENISDDLIFPVCPPLVNSNMSMQKLTW